MLAQHPHSFPVLWAPPTSQLSEWDVKWGTIATPRAASSQSFPPGHYCRLRVSMNVPFLLCSHFEHLPCHPSLTKPLQLPE